MDIKQTKLIGTSIVICYFSSW